MKNVKNFKRKFPSRKMMIGKAVFKLTSQSPRGSPKSEFKAHGYPSPKNHPWRREVFCRAGVIPVIAWTPALLFYLRFLCLESSWGRLDIQEIF